MELEIRLADGQLFWFLPGGKCHLSSDNPGPIVVDFKSLSKEEQKQIILSGRSKTINLSLHDTALVEEFNGQKFQAPIVATPPIKQDEYAEKLKSILDGSNNSIKKELGLITNIRDLHILKKIEIENKNRSKIIRLLLDRSNYLINQVASSINTEEATIDTQSNDPLADSMEINESEIETREIPLGD